jgi:O-antigen ligase
LPSRQLVKLTAGPAARRFYPGGMRRERGTGQSEQKNKKFSWPFFWLTTFYVVYCARPTDLIPGLGLIRLAKITGGLAILTLFLSLRKSKRQLKDLPREAYYLLFLMILLSASAVFSPVWRGGAVNAVFDFGKVLFVWIATFLIVTTLSALRRIIFIQSASVALITFAAVVKGHNVPRLVDVIGGFYANPNDMAFAIVLSIPFCLAFLLTTRSVPRKIAWLLAIISMCVALLLTASRAGLIDLAISGTVLLWHFGAKGKRPHLIFAAVLLSAVLWLVAGKQLAVRLSGLFSGGETQEQSTAHESYLERRLLMQKSLEAVEEYPILGLGAGNFIVHSGMWRDVHMSYLQIAVDGGIPVLILYVLFFARGFANLRILSKTKNLDDETVLFVGALKSALVGFVVGACFAPEAYQFFPCFLVCYTSIVLAMVKERERSESLVSGKIVDLASTARRKGSLSRGRLNELIHTR